MTSSQKMLALVTDAFGGRGGIARYNQDFLSALADSEGLSSIVVVPRLAPDRVATPPRINQTPARLSRITYSLGALWTAFQRPFDFVFCGHIYMAPLGGLIAYVKGAKLIVQMHGIEAWPRPSRLCRAAVERADLILCVSRYTRACVVNWSAFSPDRILVVPNTVSEAFTPGDAALLRKEWDLQGKRILLTVGRIDSRERYKGHDRVIAALPHLVGMGYDVAYVIVGEGDDQARLTDLAQKAGVSNRVRFMGALERETLLDVYRMADLFVMPSTGEGFGIAFLEAMASGTPALGLAAGGALDPLADGELGTATSESGFVTALQQQIDLVKPDPDTLSAAVRARFGRQSFEGGVRAVLDRLKERAA